VPVTPPASGELLLCHRENRNVAVTVLLAERGEAQREPETSRNPHRTILRLQVAATTVGPLNQRVWPLSARLAGRRLTPRQV